MSGTFGHGVAEAIDGILAAAVNSLDASYGVVIESTGGAADGWRSVHEHFTEDELMLLQAGIRAAHVPERLADAGLPVVIADLPWGGTVATGAPVQVLAVPILPSTAGARGLAVAAAGRRPFGRDDARLLEAVAATAAIAFEAAILRSDLERREAWSDASAELVSALLTDLLDSPLGVVASRVLALAQADGVFILRRDGTNEALSVTAAAGTDGLAIGDRVPLRGTVPGEAIESLQPRVVATAVLPLLGGHGAPRPAGPMMVAPMMSADAAIGAVVVCRRLGSPAFSSDDLDLLASFVGHTTVALQLAEVRADRERILLIEERARIARDLHDSVIQQLFAAGLELRATAAEAPLPRVQAGVDHGVALIDGAIDRLRTAVLAISTDRDRATLRHRILDVVHDLSREFAEPPELRFTGPVELVVRGDLADDVVAVVREALTNVARHATATHAGVQVAVLDGRIRVEVWDDGRGMPASVQRSGLANLEQRATHRRGEFSIAGGERTRAIWTVPYGGSDT